MNYETATIMFIKSSLNLASVPLATHSFTDAMCGANGKYRIDLWIQREKPHYGACWLISSPFVIVRAAWTGALTDCFVCALCCRKKRKNHVPTVLGEIAQCALHRACAIVRRMFSRCARVKNWSPPYTPSEHKSIVYYRLSFCFRTWDSDKQS